MAYPGKFNLVLSKLHLGAFTTVYEEELIPNFQYLGGRIKLCCWGGCVAA